MYDEVRKGTAMKPKTLLIWIISIVINTFLNASLFGYIFQVTGLNTTYFQLLTETLSAFLMDIFLMICLIWMFWKFLTSSKDKQKAILKSMKKELMICYLILLIAVIALFLFKQTWRALFLAALAFTFLNPGVLFLIISSKD